MKGKLIIISSYSGGGKTSIIKALLKRHPQWHFSVSATSRDKRANERDGVDYRFLTKAQFQEMIDKNQLIEFELVHGNYYGTPLSELEKRADGEPILFDLDVNGALQIAEKFPENISIFIDVPNMEILKKRLIGRHTESPETISKRLERIELEREKRRYFQYIVENTDLDKAIRDVENIICKKEDK
jgi:guanylate kinase